MPKFSAGFYELHVNSLSEVMNVGGKQTYFTINNSLK